LVTILGQIPSGVGVGLGIGVASSVGVWVAGGGIGVAFLGRPQVESNTSRSKPHSINLAFIALPLLLKDLFYTGLSYLASWSCCVKREKPT
jgi:hypothetical protein